MTAPAAAKADAMPDFNLGFPEIATLIVIAIIIFGPEKLPDLARKTARVLAYVRGIANDARGQLTEQLGPEFADLRPRSIVASLLSDQDVGELKAVAADTKQVLTQTGGALQEAGQSVVDQGRSVATSAGVVTEPAASESVAVPPEPEPDDMPRHVASANPSLLGSAAPVRARPAPFDPDCT